MEKSESDDVEKSNKKFSSSSAGNSSPPSPSTKSSKKRERITPSQGRTRGPHPPSPTGQDILQLVSQLPREGYLARNPTGYIFLDLDDDWIFSVQDEMEKFGYEVPPYFFGPQAVGAHVSVVPANLAKDHKEGMVEVGKRVEFEVVRASTTFPIRYWYGTEAVFKIWVKSPELTRISKKIAGSRYNPPGGFNIVVGIRTIEKRDQMVKEKESKKKATKKSKK